VLCVLQGGIYHGRILVPPEYPFKPPAFSFLTVRCEVPKATRVWQAPLTLAHLCQQPNGRFEVNTKICLSISSYHPEHWQPSWSIRTALVALTAFFPTTGDGAIGALAYSKEERKALAAASRLTPPTGGQSEARAAVTRSIHERMLAMERTGSSTFSEDAAVAAAAGAVTRQAIAAVLARAAQQAMPPSPPPQTQSAPPCGESYTEPLAAVHASPGIEAAAASPQVQRPAAAQPRHKVTATDDAHLVALAVVLAALWLWLLARRMMWGGSGDNHGGGKTMQFDTL
jgi:hypothetical protein